MLRGRFGFSWLKTAWEEDLWVARRCCWMCLSQAFTMSTGALGCVSAPGTAPCAWLGVAGRGCRAVPQFPLSVCRRSSLWASWWEARRWCGLS